MKITLLTSNRNRHNYLINLLSTVCDELFVIQECGTIFPGAVPGHYPVSNLMVKYFEKVNNAQLKFFGNTYVGKYSKNIKTLPIIFGDLGKCSLSFLSEFLQSDFYLVFGCSYIKGDLVNFLVEKKAVNIHMGVSPYYRGTDCNFWALYDNNPHLVGATIHYLSKGIDSGPILYHAMSKIKLDPFEYTMSTVKSAFHSILERIKNGEIFNYKPIIQLKSKEIRYSKKIEFNDDIIEKYFSKQINLQSKKFNRDLLIKPFFLD